MIRTFRAILSAALRTILSDPYRLLLLVAVAIYLIIFVGLAFDLHNGMRTHRADLGQIAQAVWNSSRGRFVEMTDNGFVATRMTDHVEPILALISPVLWFWEDAKALLLVQALAVAAGALLLYALTIRRLDTLLSPRERAQIWQIEPLRQLTRPLALALALAYLLTPQLQSALLTEFHAAPLAVPLILWAFLAIDARHAWQMALAILLVATVKEEMALLAAGLALWAIWRTLLGQWQTTGRAPRLDRRFAPSLALPCALLLGSLFWFYLATFVIVPAHATQVYATDQSVYFERYGALGDSPLDIVKSFVTQPTVVWQIATEPARLAYLWGLLAPFGFLSLLAPEILLLALPLLLANLLSAYPAQYYGDFHYSAPLIPYVAVSAAYGLARAWRWSGRLTSGQSASYQHMPAASTGVMAVVSLLTNARTALRPIITLLFGIWILGWASAYYVEMGRGPWGGHYDPVVDTAETYAHQRLLPYFVAQIPHDAAVTATAAVHPHVSLRRYVYQFPLGLPEIGTAGTATWALLDVTTNTDMAPGDLKSTVESLLAGEWGVVDGADGFLLLHRGAPSHTIPDAFFDFARSTQPLGDRPLVATTALVHTAAHQWFRWRSTKVTAEWQVGETTTTDFAPTLNLVASNGDPLYSLTGAAPPTLIWYPPAQWQPGERIRVTTAPLWLPRMWGIVTDSSASASALALAQSADQAHVLVDRYRQGDQGVVAVPVPAGTPPFASAYPTNAATVNFQDEAGQLFLSLRGWGDGSTMRAGQPYLVWLRWIGSAWPEGVSVFVHLRVNGETVAQQDGPPRFFVFPDAGAVLAKNGALDDLRELPVPADLAPGQSASIVVGLYDRESGRRFELVDREQLPLGNEWIVAEVPIKAAPPPDQACALIPPSCATQ